MVKKDELRADVESKKLEPINGGNMKRNEYFTAESLENTRVMFIIRTIMIDRMANYKNKPKRWMNGFVKDVGQILRRTTSR